MAHNEHLPIYKSAYDLCLWLEQVVRGFSRYHKYAIDDGLREGIALSPARPAVTTLRAGTETSRVAPGSAA